MTKLIGFTLLCTLMMTSCNRSVHINDEFTIEYMEMFSSVSLRSKLQGFVPQVTKAYWNKDSLVVSGSTGCFLILFGKTKYNDEMIKIECGNLNKRIKYSEKFIDGFH